MTCTIQKSTMPAIGTAKMMNHARAVAAEAIISGGRNDAFALNGAASPARHSARDENFADLRPLGEHRIPGTFRFNSADARGVVRGAQLRFVRRLTELNPAIGETLETRADSLLGAMG